VKCHETIPYILTRLKQTREWHDQDRRTKKTKHQAKATKTKPNHKATKRSHNYENKMNIIRTPIERDGKSKPTTRDDVNM
jgi:hypothetical protein